MCGLCMWQSPFKVTRPSALDALKARAAEVKTDILVYEGIARLRAEQGQPPCDAAAQRLQDLRAEQFELARKL